MAYTNIQILDTNDLISDLNQMVIPVVHDTSAVSLVDSTDVSVNHQLLETQPNGWLLLFFSIAIPLFVVFLEKWVSRYYENRDGKAARKQFRETVLDWIITISPIEMKFSESVHDLAGRIKKSDDMLPVPYALPLTLPNKMMSMSIEIMSEMFLKDFKEEKDRRYSNMYNIISNLEYLSKATNSALESYKSYNSQSFALCKEWNSLYETFLNKCNALKDKNPYSAVITIWFAQLISSPNSINVHIKALEAMSIIAFNENDFDMMSLVSKMMNIAKQNQATSVGFAKVFSDMANNIDSSLKSLSEAVQFFRENEIK